MRYLIIGLGIYGSNLAIDLTKMGHEVIGADKDPMLVDSIKDFISTAYIIDSTDETSLSVLPLKNVDLVIVAIGENFGASIRTVAILKKLEIPHIYARAIDKLHESILQGFNIDRIITPEQRAAADLVNEISLGIQTVSMHVDRTNMVMKFPLPPYFEGMKYDSLQLEKDFGLALISALRKQSSRNILGIAHDEYSVVADLFDGNQRVEPGDLVVCFGPESAYRKFVKHFSSATA